MVKFLINFSVYIKTMPSNIISIYMKLKFTLLFIISLFIIDMALAENKARIHNIVNGVDRDNFCLIIGDIPYCWGNNSAVNGYSYGKGKKKIRYAYPPKGLHTGGVTKIVLPQSGEYGCAIKDRAVWCWGDSRKLGPVFPYMSIKRAIKIPVVDKNIIDVETGSWCACAIKADNKLAKSGALYCWGDPDYVCPFTLEEYNKAKKTTNTKIVPIKGMQYGVTKVAIKNRHGCAIKDEEVYCWGRDSDASVGVGVKAFIRKKHITKPNKVVGLPKGIIDIAVTGYFSCALHKSGQVWCWGMMTNDRIAMGFMDIDRSRNGKLNPPEIIEFKKRHKLKLAMVNYSNPMDDGKMMWLAPEALPHPKYPKGSGVVRLKPDYELMSVYKKGKKIVDSFMGGWAFSIIYGDRDEYQKRVTENANEIATGSGTCHIEDESKVMCRSNKRFLPSRFCTEYGCSSTIDLKQWQQVEFAPVNELKDAYEN